MIIAKKMKEIGIDELKKLQLDILLSVHDFCIKNQIEYSLAAGTLIGAIRHKGYIPWDDDIDICMTRPNYDRFINSFNGTYKNLHVLAPELNWNYYAPYANVCDIRTILNERANGHRGIEVGVKIDVFPIDGTSNSLQGYRFLCNKIYDYNYIMSYKRYILSKGKFPYNIKVLFKKLQHCFTSYAYLQKKIHRLSLSNDFDKAEFVSLMVFDPIAFRAPQKIFEEYVDVEFEGYKLRSVKYFDLFLSLRYGDYMKLPPIEQQVPHHGFTAYWKD